MWLCIHSCIQFEDTFENSQWRKVKQMQPVWLCILWPKQFEDSFENPQWRKIKQMQPMWLCIFTGRRFEETFENTQWRKAKQMQPLWLCLFSGMPFEETFKNAHWRWVKQMQSMILHNLLAHSLRRYLKIHEHQINQCDVFSLDGNLRIPNSDKTSSLPWGPMTRQNCERLFKCKYIFKLTIYACMCYHVHPLL